MMCGFVGMVGEETEDVAALIYDGLDALQHRGEESAGMSIAVNGHHRVFVGSGLVRDVFRATKFSEWRGSRGIGHVRYATAGGNGDENAQPMHTMSDIGPISIAHNGNLVGTETLRTELSSVGLSPEDSDTRLILQMLLIETGNIEERLVKVLRRVRGAYSLVVLAGRTLIAVRDPHGVRPICYGKRGNGWVVASETHALDVLGAEFENYVRPGEMLIISDTGMLRRRFPFPQSEQRFCVFESIYFAWPKSELEDGSVAESRIDFGRSLARACPADADIIVPILRSGYFAAKGFSLETGMPDIEALMRATKSSRTFILPDQDARRAAVRRKHQVIKRLVVGKRLVLVDDSIVRGTTLREIVGMLFDAGAAEVHVRISSPPVTGPCHYGIDTPTRRELISHAKSVEEICAFIGATSLGYLPLQDLHAAANQSAREPCTHCDACFSGNYPIPIG